MRQLNGTLPQIMVEMFEPGWQLVHGTPAAVTRLGIAHVAMRLRP